MGKVFLLKAGLLVILLAAVLAAIVLGMQADQFGSAARRASHTQTFFEQFVTAGGPIVWFVLLPMSLITVYLAVDYSLTINRRRLVPAQVGLEISELIRQSGLKQLKQEISDSGLVSAAVLQVIGNGGGDWFRMRNLVAESLQEQASTLLRKIEWVSLIGNVSPMIGLFGTVFGMIKLFNSIVTADGSPNAGLMAGGISVALVTTFWGLLVAIPALTAHGILKNRIEKIIADAACEVDVIVTEISRQVKAAVRQNTKIQKNRVTAIDLTPKTKKVTADFS